MLVQVNLFILFATSHCTIFRKTSFFKSSLTDNAMFSDDDLFPWFGPHFVSVAYAEPLPHVGVHIQLYMKFLRSYMYMY